MLRPFVLLTPLITIIAFHQADPQLVWGSFIKILNKNLILQAVSKHSHHIFDTYPQLSPTLQRTGKAMCRLGLHQREIGLKIVA